MDEVSAPTQHAAVIGRLDYLDMLITDADGSPARCGPPSTGTWSSRTSLLQPGPVGMHLPSDG